MRTLKLTLQYLGTHYCGWQIQPNGPTIQAKLQEVLSRTLREKIVVTASGRTDSGVHALAQVAHFRTQHDMDLPTLLRALNGQLPQDIAVTQLEEVSETFHAMKDAQAKTYLYLIFQSQQAWPLLNPFSWRQRRALNETAMQQCLNHIVGAHDFKSFCAADACTKTSVRTILNTHLKAIPLPHLTQSLAQLLGLTTPLLNQVVHSEPRLLALSFTGQGFLKHMVRNLVGTLVDVGLEKINYENFVNILHACDRRKAGITAPARGLFLVNVKY